MPAASGGVLQGQQPGVAVHVAGEEPGQHPGHEGERRVLQGHVAIGDQATEDATSEGEVARRLARGRPGQSGPQCHHEQHRREQQDGLGQGESTPRGLLGSLRGVRRHARRRRLERRLASGPLRRAHGTGCAHSSAATSSATSVSVASATSGSWSPAYRTTTFAPGTSPPTATTVLPR